MDYRDTVFLSVAEHSSFTKASSDLGISQPAITRHIKALEDHYQTSLFERRGNKIFLTVSGEKVHAVLRDIAQQYRNLDFEIGQINNNIFGEFKIGASSTISQYIIPRVIASFHKKYPKIQIHLMNGNSFEMEKLLLSNQVDLALVENNTSQSGIQYKKFLNDELVVVTGKNSTYAKREALSKDELIKAPIVLREQGSGTLEVIKQACIKHDLDFESLNKLIHLGSTESIKNFLQDFDGIAIISKHAIQTEIQLKNLVRLETEDFIIPRQLRIAYKQGHKSNQVELFEYYLLAYVQSL
jgi:DNA-binding transcriptional LysR family regulator